MVYPFPNCIEINCNVNSLKNIIDSRKSWLLDLQLKWRKTICTDIVIEKRGQFQLRDHRSNQQATHCVCTHRLSEPLHKDWNRNTSSNEPIDQRSASPPLATATVDANTIFFCLPDK